LFVMSADNPGDLGRVFWRHFDHAHPAYDPEQFFTYADTWEASYRALDTLAAELTAGDADAALVIVSAYGCHPFRRAVDLNRWLWENGYLRLAAGAGAYGIGSPIPEVVIHRGHYRPAIDWPGTAAHAQGYGQIYLNVKGRDRDGRVPPREMAALKDELRARLFAIRDGGKPVVAAVDEGGAACAGPRGYCAPDLLVSLAEGYRVSDESVTGGMAAAVLADNKTTVSGDAASMAAAAVPGLVLANVRLENKNAGVEDIAPTILDLLGLEPSPEMQGRSLWTG
jgi:predicted AlkP superfamily phosphohydrolase/phosphomutase